MKDSNLLKKYAIHSAAAAACVTLFSAGVSSAEAALNPLTLTKTAVVTKKVVTKAVPVIVPIVAADASGYEPPTKGTPTTTPPVTPPPAPPPPPPGGGSPPPPPPPAF